MTKKRIIFLISILALIGIWASKKIIRQKEKQEKPSVSSLAGIFYWTCPMHPQIHLEHSGECPICHMKLVQVKAKSTEQSQAQKQSNPNELTDKRSALQVSPEQLSVIGIQKTTIQKMNLVARIPISGRIASSNSVVFQVYENDLRSIRPGLTFTGESSTSSEERISGVITSVDNLVDPTSRTIRVVGAIKKGAKNLLPETSFSGDIQIELKDRLVVPESSVMHTGRNDLIYIFTEGNKLTAKNVKLGIKTEGFFEVLEGLQVGDQISSGPNFLIDSEAKIRGAGQ